MTHLATSKGSCVLEMPCDGERWTQGISVLSFPAIRARCACAKWDGGPERALYLPRDAGIPKVYGVEPNSRTPHTAGKSEHTDMRTTRGKHAPRILPSQPNTYPGLVVCLWESGVACLDPGYRSAKHRLSVARFRSIQG